MIQINVKGSTSKTERFLKQNQKLKIPNLESLAQYGVNALQAVTPVDTGKTQASWGYEIVNDGNKISITWINSNLTKDGTPVAILLQYGHATRNGGYVQGSEYIDEALRPVFQKIADDVWKEVNK